MTTKILGELRECKPDNNFSKPSTGFIDLATYNDIEKALYGGSKSITYFIRETVKSSWFSQIPIQMHMNEDNPDFGQTFSVNVSREGDYLTNAWLRVSLGGLSMYYPNNENTPGQYWRDPNGSGSETLSWTPNFMHNLVEKCILKVNGMVVDEIYSEHLDFYSAFMIPKSSRIGYNRMIGNFNKPFFGLSAANVSGYNTYKQTANNLNYQQELFLPLPFFFSKDTGLALPMVSLPYNEISIEFKFRRYQQLLGSITKEGSILPINASQTNDSDTLLDTKPVLYDVQVWGNYAIVNEKERKKVGCLTRDMVIEQNQQLGESYGSSDLNVNNIDSTTSINLRFDGAIKALFFAARNSSGSTDLPYRSNYTTSTPSASDITVCKISVSGVAIGACTDNSSDSWAGLEVVDSNGLATVVNALFSSITTQTSGASDNTYTGVVSTSSGAGTGATFTVIILGGVVTSITVELGGSGYAVLDTVTIDAVNIGNGGDLVITLEVGDIGYIAGTTTPITVSGVNPGSIYSPYNTSCTISASYVAGTNTAISYNFAPGTKDLTDFIAADSRNFKTSAGLHANAYQWGPRVLYSELGELIGLVTDVSSSTVTFADETLVPLAIGEYIFLTSYPPGAPAGIDSGMKIYTSGGSSYGNITSVTYDTISINASGVGTLYDLNDGDKLYYSWVEGLPTSTSVLANGAPPPVNINLNYFNLNDNDRSGLVWETSPTNPIGTAKIVYENETRMDMESLYYSLLQPYEHANNVPDSGAMKGIMSLRNPTEVSGEPALSVGYHMYSYALNLKNQDPCGSTDYSDLKNASLVLTPSMSAVNNYTNGQGPWRIFVSAINQNVIRIDKGAMNFPVL